jgi:AmmeMemoRadiSam system protein B
MDIRPSPIAGTWYPGDAESLAVSIDQFLHDANPNNIEGQIVGLIVPHAGHRYSGSVAAHAFRLIQGYAPEVIAILSPLHAYAEGSILTSGHEAYTTPLGIVPIDRDLVGKLEKVLDQNHGIKLGHLRNDREHSLEIELPFLQRCVETSFRLIPIMLREQSTRIARLLGESLGMLLQDRDCLIIASSDLSHFYPQQTAERLDRRMLDHLEHFDPEGLIEAEEHGLGFACGRGAMAAALWSTRALGADHVEVLKHATSGDATGDFDSVVGYGSAVIYQLN